MLVLGYHLCVAGSRFSTNSQRVRKNDILFSLAFSRFIETFWWGVREFWSSLICIDFGSPFRSCIRISKLRMRKDLKWFSLRRQQNKNFCRKKMFEVNVLLGLRMSILSTWIEHKREHRVVWTIQRSQEALSEMLRFCWRIWICVENKRFCLSHIAIRFPTFFCFRIIFRSMLTGYWKQYVFTLIILFFQMICFLPFCQKHVTVPFYMDESFPFQCRKTKTSVYAKMPTNASEEWGTMKWWFWFELWQKELYLSLWDDIGEAGNRSLWNIRFIYVQWNRINLKQSEKITGTEFWLTQRSVKFMDNNNNFRPILGNPNPKPIY